MTVFHYSCNTNLGNCNIKICPCFRFYGKVLQLRNALDRSYELNCSDDCLCDNGTCSQVKGICVCHESKEETLSSICIIPMPHYKVALLHYLTLIFITVSTKHH